MLGAGGSGEAAACAAGGKEWSMRSKRELMWVATTSPSLSSDVLALKQAEPSPEILRLCKKLAEAEYAFSYQFGFISSTCII